MALFHSLSFFQIGGCIFRRTAVYCTQKTTEYFVFRAGRNSPLAVKSATGCLWYPLTRCNSGTNSIVWMEEDEYGEDRARLRTSLL